MYFILPMDQKSIQVDQDHQKNRNDQKGKDGYTDGYSVYQHISSDVSIGFSQKIHSAYKREASASALNGGLS